MLEPLWQLRNTRTGEDVSIEWLEKHPDVDAVLHSCCAGSYALTRRWFEENGMKFEDYEEMFREAGGHCDCTVYMNSLPILLRRSEDVRRR